MPKKVEGLEIHSTPSVTSCQFIQARKLQTAESSQVSCQRVPSADVEASLPSAQPEALLIILNPLTCAKSQHQRNASQRTPFEVLRQELPQNTANPFFGLKLSSAHRPFREKAPELKLQQHH